MKALTVDMLRSATNKVCDPAIEALCLDDPGTCVDLVIKALVKDGKTLLEMSADLEARFPSLAELTDNGKRTEMLRLIVAAAHFHTGHTLEIIQAAHNGLSTADNLRGVFRGQMDEFMTKVMKLQDDWGSLENLTGFARMNILDVPAQAEWVKKYNRCLNDTETDIGLCIDRDDAERLVLFLDYCGNRKPTRSTLVNLFYTRDDLLSPKTRKRVLGHVEPQGEEIYARILNAVANLNCVSSKTAFIPPSSVPEGFFEKHSDLIWYSIAKDMGNSQTIESVKDKPGASMDSINQAASAMLYLLKFGGSPFSGLWAAQIEGHNIGSIENLRASVDKSKAVKFAIGHLSNKVHLVDSNGNLFKTEVGQAKAFAMAKAIAVHYGPDWLSSVVTKDSQRIFLYRVSGDHRFLNGLESEKAQANLFERDLGL
jgi:hypothetical protein